MLEQRAVYLPHPLPRAPNCHRLLAPMPNAVRLHQVAPPGCALCLACMAV